MRISDWSSDVCSSDLVIVVDADRVPQNHGMPPKLLECEFAAVGYKLVEMHDMPSAGGYLAAFRAVGPRPEPEALKPCRFQPRLRRDRQGLRFSPPALPGRRQQLGVSDAPIIRTTLLPAARKACSQDVK